VGFRREMLEDNDVGLNNFEEEFTNVALVSGLRRIVKGGWGGCKVMELGFSFVIPCSAVPASVRASGDMLVFGYQSFCSSRPTLQLPRFQSGRSSSAPR